MLTTEGYGVADAQASIQKNVECNALARSYRPSGLKSCDFCLVLRFESLAWPARNLQALRLVDGDEISILCPFAQGAHCRQKMLRLASPLDDRVPRRLIRDRA
jgi:hypothetical protein